MSTTKRIFAAILSVMLVLGMVTVSLAEETIGVSVSASALSVYNTTSCSNGGTFDLYFAADKLEAEGKKLNTYKFTIWYDANVLELTSAGVSNLASVEGFTITEAATKTVGTTVYTGYTHTFASFEKGLGNVTGNYKSLVKIPFKALAAGTTEVFIEAADISLHPVVTDANLSDTISASVVNNKVTVTVLSAGGVNPGSGSPSGGAFFGGGASVTARKVVFNVDGVTSTVSIEDGKKVAKPLDPAKEGYTFAGWYTDKTYANLYDFNAKVVADITLYAKFVKNADVPAPQTKLPFTDVKEGDWFYQGVEYVWSKNMVKGVTETEYAPNNTLTRATLVTLLYRLENEPQAPQNTFADVASGSWYENAVAWAADKGIVLGMGEGLFAPDANITREQIAVILYKYAAQKGKDTSKTADLGSFTDVNDISEWAKDAVAWAVAEGLLQGMGDGSVAPGASATRAQIATILMRYMQ